MIKVEKPKEPKPNFNINKLVVKVPKESLQKTAIQASKVKLNIQNVVPEALQQSENAFEVY